MKEQVKEDRSLLPDPSQPRSRKNHPGLFKRGLKNADGTPDTRHLAGGWNNREWRNKNQKTRDNAIEEAANSIERLKAIASDPTQPAGARVSADKLILSYALGNPSGELERVRHAQAEASNSLADAGELTTESLEKFLADFSAEQEVSANCPDSETPKV